MSAGLRPRHWIRQLAGGDDDGGEGDLRGGTEEDLGDDVEVLDREEVVVDREDEEEGRWHQDQNPAVTFEMALRIQEDCQC